MLRDYENDRNIGIDVDWLSNILLDYICGYPFLVSRLCQIMEENAPGGWSKEGFQQAVRELLKTPNTLFDDMSKKLSENPELKEMSFEMKLYNFLNSENEIVSKIFTAADMGKNQFIKSSFRFLAKKERPPLTMRVTVSLLSFLDTKCGI